MNTVDIHFHWTWPYAANILFCNISKRGYYSLAQWHTFFSLTVIDSNKIRWRRKLYIIVLGIFYRLSSVELKFWAKILRDLNVQSVSLLSVWTHIFHVVVSSWIKKCIQGGIIYQRLNTKKKRSKNSKILFFVHLLGCILHHPLNSFSEWIHFQVWLKMAFKISEMMKITILNFPSKHTPTFPTNNHHVYFHDVSDEVKD